MSHDDDVCMVVNNAETALRRLGFSNAHCKPNNIINKVSRPLSSPETSHPSPQHPSGAGEEESVSPSEAVIAALQRTESDPAYGVDDAVKSYVSASSATNVYSSVPPAETPYGGRVELAACFFGVVDRYRFDREVVEVALHYLDRYLLHRKIRGEPVLRLKETVKYSLASLGLAIKLFSPCSGCQAYFVVDSVGNVIHESILSRAHRQYDRNGPRTSLSGASCGAVDTIQLADAEACICETLGWRLLPATSSAFVRAFLDLIEGQGWKRDFSTQQHQGNKAQGQQGQGRERHHRSAATFEEIERVALHQCHLASCSSLALSSPLALSSTVAVAALRNAVELRRIDVGRRVDESEGEEDDAKKTAQEDLNELLSKVNEVMRLDPVTEDKLRLGSVQECLRSLWHACTKQCQRAKKSAAGVPKDTKDTKSDQGIASSLSSKKTAVTPEKSLEMAKDVIAAPPSCHGEKDRHQLKRCLPLEDEGEDSVSSSEPIVQDRSGKRLRTLVA